MQPEGGTPSSSAAVQGELQPGAAFSHYRLIEQIGRGGMGTVYRARDTRLARDVAIKVLNPEIATDPDRIARFRREATIVAALDHPGIVVIHDTGHENGVEYLVTELVDGVSLRTTMRKERTLGARRAADIGAQLADALGAAHARGILHRDVKPENVIVTRTGRAKLLDFGLAKSHQAVTGDEETRSTTLPTVSTATGIVMGTLRYMSPEQLRGRSLDARSDVFSLGVVLYEMLAGTRPFDGPTTVDVVSAVLRGEPTPLPDSIAPPLRAVVLRCLKAELADRFQSASDLSFALRNAIDTPPAPAAVADAPRHRSLARMVAAVGAVLAVIVATGAYLRWGGTGGSAAPQVRPIATEAYGEAQPIWSPDGRSLAYVASAGGEQIFVRDLNTPSPVAVLRCPALCDTVGWSADGARVLYTSRTNHLNARLWSVARTGGTPVPMFKEDVVLLAAAMSPGGERLALLQVVTNPNGPGRRYGLFLSSPPGAPPVRFGQFPLLSLVTPNRLAWSADATRLLVSSIGASRLFVVSLNEQAVDAFPISRRVDLSWGTDPRFAIAARPASVGRTGLEWFDTRTGHFLPLLSSESVLSYPSVSPDGTKVAYTAGDVDHDLVQMPLDGSPIRPLLASRLPEHSVHFSPRGPEFAYTAGGQGEEIRIRHPGTLAERVVVSQADFADTEPVSFSAPAFSPDGTKLAYNRNFEIWISQANGGSPTKLREAEVSGEFGAEWSPDGVWIAFTSARPGDGGLQKVRVGAREAAVRLRSRGCGQAPAWSPDGAWIACGREPTGLDLVPADGGPARDLGPHYEMTAAWARDSSRLYVIRALGGRRELGELTWRTGAFRRIADVPPDFAINGNMSWTGRLSLSADGRSLVTSVLRATGDIWIADGIQPPQGLWARLPRPR